MLRDWISVVVDFVSNLIREIWKSSRTSHCSYFYKNSLRCITKCNRSHHYEIRLCMSNNFCNAHMRIKCISLWRNVLLVLSNTLVFSSRLPCRCLFCSIALFSYSNTHLYPRLDISSEIRLHQQPSPHPIIPSQATHRVTRKRNKAL